MSGRIPAWLVAALAASLAAAGTSATRAGDALPTPVAPNMLSPGRTFAETNGASLYANACQGCHMADARGAIGAGSYPSLAGDQNLEAAGYVVAVVVRGQRAMPAVGRSMTDEQVAAVADYVRSHFGNAYPDAVTAAEVKAARP
ncbi:c-type cytochrome [Lichenifustis flavocetrariae]|uniref:Cytochrome c n=1 Tax=Lichenifustis flavocetrariae TaxID=2949735 RepID=A0AA41Z911_9HYPH|nr:cytochrome c [Lichenifustis flavocetrariae]MCW6512728.1 cytochrome c [Lichenifustis flavocetrariae]